MKSSRLFSLLAALLLTPALHAAPISWNVSTVSGPGDVSTAGVPVGAMNVGVNSPQTINGVSFIGDLGGTGLNLLGSGVAVAISFQNGGNYDLWPQADPGGDAAYNNALDAARFSDAVSSGTFTFSGLTVGRTYEVQLWIVDTRGSGLNTRVRTVKGDEATATSTTSGGPNIARGLFVASNAVQTITIADPAGPGSHGPQLNLLQLRDLSPADIVNNLAEALDGSDPINGAGIAAAHAFTTGPQAARLREISVRMNHQTAGSGQVRVKLWSGPGSRSSRISAS